MEEEEEKGEEDSAGKEKEATNYSGRLRIARKMVTQTII